MVPKCIYLKFVTLLQLGLSTQLCVCESPTWTCMAVVHSFPSWRSCWAQQCVPTSQVLYPFSRGWIFPSHAFCSHCKQYCHVHSCIYLLEFMGENFPKVYAGRGIVGLWGRDILTVTKLLSKDSDHQNTFHFPVSHLSFHRVLELVYLCVVKDDTKNRNGVNVSVYT